MCQYDEEPDFETVWSSIFDLEHLLIYRAEGDPRKKKFITDKRLHDMKQRMQNKKKITSSSNRLNMKTVQQNAALSHDITSI